MKSVTQTNLRMFLSGYANFGGYVPISEAASFEGPSVDKWDGLAYYYGVLLFSTSNCASASDERQ